MALQSLRWLTAAAMAAMLQLSVANFQAAAWDMNPIHFLYCLLRCLVGILYGHMLLNDVGYFLDCFIGYVLIFSDLYNEFNGP